MNKLKKTLLLFVAIITMVACNTQIIENAIDNFGIVIGLEPINTSATIIITDAKTNETVNTDVQVKFEGNNANNVIDAFSDNMNETTINSGILNFGIKNAINPDSQNPIKVKLKLTAPGFKTTEKTISISDIGSSSYTVSMINLSNPPEGITIKEDNNIISTSSDGTINDDIAISVVNQDNADNIETGVRLEVKAGSTFEDENGNTLSGDLSFTTTYYNPSSNEAVKSISENLLENVNDSSLVVLGAVETKITDSNGNEFKGKIKTNKKNTGEYIINFILNATTYSELQQVLRLAYISPTTAERFILYTVPEVSQLPNGRIELRYLLNGPLFRNMALVYFSEQPCNTNLMVNRNGNQGSLRVQIFEKGFNRSLDIQANTSTTSLKNIIRGAKTVRVELPHTTFQQNIDFCNTGSPSLELPSPPPATIDATVNVILSCENADEKVRVTDFPAASIYYRKANAPKGTAWRVATDLSWVFNSETQVMESASCKISAVEQGENYVFKVSYDGNLAQKTILINSTSVNYNETVDGSFCN
ncbi:hypothetical protein [Polaribacter sp.]|uniref:hypothetical protein n=1 Tax=Polaribacter sp. TaxID=1920175 RepID=UPI003F6B7A35